MTKLSKRQRVLMVSLSDVTLDARIRRHVRLLTDAYRVVLAAPGAPLIAEGVEFVELPLRAAGGLRRAMALAVRIALRNLGRYERAYWMDDQVKRWLAELRQVGQVEAVVVNDLWAVPLALAVAGRVPVIFDAHEHWTSESASWTKWQRLSMRGAHEWIVDHAVPKLIGMTTVSRGIAADFQRRVGVLPLIVTNAPFFHALTPTRVHDPIRLLHVGLADERRNLEDTIEAVRKTGATFTLDLILVAANELQGEYRKHLEQLTRGDERFRFLPPVANDAVIPVANQYDVGVFLLPAEFPNQVHVLPNKLFDYIQARLAVAIGPSPEMAALVNEFDCGVVSDSFSTESFAQALGRMSVPEVARLKANADRAARHLTAERNREIVVGLLDRACAA